MTPRPPWFPPWLLCPRPCPYLWHPLWAALARVMRKQASRFGPAWPVGCGVVPVFCSLQWPHGGSHEAARPQGRRRLCHPQLTLPIPSKPCQNARCWCSPQPGLKVHHRQRPFRAVHLATRRSHRQAHHQRLNRQLASPAQQVCRLPMRPKSPSSQPMVQLPQNPLRHVAQASRKSCSRRLYLL